MKLKNFTFKALLLGLLTLGTFQAKATETSLAPEVIVSNDTAITVSTPILFTDEGGSTGDYTQPSSSVSNYVTFTPADASKSIRITLQECSLSSYDYLACNFGTSHPSGYTNDYKFKTGQTVPFSVISTDSQGALCFKIYKASYGGGSHTGWQILVEQDTPAPLSFGSAVSSDVTPSTKVLPNMTDVPMLKTTLNILGDKGSISLDGFKASLGQSTLSAFLGAKLYLTTTDNFSTQNLIGTSTSQTDLQFACTETLTAPGTYYLWVCYDISGQALVGQTLQCSSTELTVGGQNQTLTPGTSSVTISSGVHGNYTIGNSSTADYSSLAAAFNAIKEGIDGPVVFSIESGTYDRQVDFPEVIGASSINTITIQRALASETVKYIYTPSYGSSSTYIWSINGTDYLKVDGIDFEGNSADWNALVSVKDHATNVSFTACSFQAPAPTSGYSGTNLLKSSCGSGINQNNDNLTVDHCSFFGGYSSIYISAAGQVAYPKEYGLKVLNSTFTESYAASLYVTKEKDYTIDHNTFLLTSGKSSNKAIDIYSMANSTISNNKITCDAPSNVYGIYLRGFTDETTTASSHIFNNAIVFRQTNGLSYGIFFADPINDIDLVYNTIDLRGTTSAATSSATMFLDDGGQNIVIKDNILLNHAGGYVLRSSDESAFDATSSAFNNNIYYTTSTTSFTNEEGIVDFGAWRADRPDDTGSVNFDVTFSSSSLLSPSVTTNFPLGDSYTYITTDILNTLRSTTPTVGAYESGAAVSLAQMLTGYPMQDNITSRSVTFKVKTSASTNVYALAVPASDEAPTADSIATSAHMISVEGNLETDMLIDGLTPQISYKVYFILKEGTLSSSVIESALFTTPFQPTEISTFEDVTMLEDGFQDGTALFKNFTIEDDYTSFYDQYSAKLGLNPNVTITNASKLQLDGFFMKNTAQVSISSFVEDSTGATHTEVFMPSDDWTYVNLRVFGALHSLTFSSTGDSYINNFSAMPNALKLEDLEGVTYAEGELIKVHPKVSEGAQPYTYSWSNSTGEVSTVDSLNISATENTTYTLTVTDAFQQTITGTLDVMVLGERKVATFENLTLTPESYWRGDTTQTSDAYSYIQSAFFSGSFQFPNSYNPSFDSWAFFAYSNETSTVSDGAIAQQYRSAVGHGVDHSDNYLVAYVDKYMGPAKITLTNKVDGDTIPGVYISNSAWVKYAVLQGDNMSEEADGSIGKPFTTGDSLVLVLSVLSTDNTVVGTKEIMLADYRDADTTKHYVLDTWQWVDLSDLGNVKTLKLSIQSSKHNTVYGSQAMSTPAYVCIDNLGASCPFETLAPQTIAIDSEVSLDLTTLISDLWTQGTTSYTLLKSQNIHNMTASLDEAGLLHLNGNQDTTLSFMAMNHGQRRYFTLPLVFAAPTLTLVPLSPLQVNEGDLINFYPQISGGVAPYTYVWTNALRTEVSTTLALEVPATYTQQYTLTVTDAASHSVSSLVTVNVTGQRYIADFEDLYLDPESHWAGEDDHSGDMTIYADAYSGTYSFPNSYTPAWASWTGMAYANETSTDFLYANYYTEQFRCAAGHGVNLSSNYGVAYLAVGNYTGIVHASIKVTNQALGDSIPGLYINNTAWVKDAIVNGDHFSTAPDYFVQGDSAAIWFYGMNTQGDTLYTHHILIADYRSAVEAEHYVLDTWQWVDLSSFGTVNKVNLEMTSTKGSEWGINTPSYVCLDNIGASCPLEETTAEINTNSEGKLNLTQLYPDLWTNGLTTYTLQREATPGQATFSLSQAGVLSANSAQTGTQIVRVKATNLGRSRYFQITINFTLGTGWNEVSTEGSLIMAQDHQLIISSSLKAYTIKLYAINGRLVADYGVQSENASLRLPQVSAGIYLVTLQSDHQTQVKKIQIVP